MADLDTMLRLQAQDLTANAFKSASENIKKLASEAGKSFEPALAARAQQRAMPVIGFVTTASPDLYSDRLRTFRQGLKEAGYVEGQNVEIEYRWAEGQNDRLPELATELVRRQVAVIVAAGGTPSALAAKAATATIPIVFGVAVDPIEVGLVASLNRPGGNLTGVTNLNAEVGPKRLELLHELLPTVTIIAALVDPTGPALAEAFSRDLHTAARTLGLELRILHASSERDFDAVFATLVQRRAGALIFRTISRAVARPSPVPAKRVVKNGSNKRRATPSPKPRPVSMTARHT
jgi:putative ABC transport system substrate-binding protein